MREIKFIAWHKFLKKMLIPERFLLNDDGTIGSFSIKGCDLQYIVKNKDDGEGLELLQSTGLRDKNGKDVFEGDIIKWQDSIGRIFTHPVTWSSNKCGFILESENFSLGIYKQYKVFEVIGNIYENENLLY